MNKPGNSLVVVATERGGFMLEQKKNGRRTKRGPFLKNESINTVNMDSEGRLYAATLTEGIFESKDYGETWKPKSRGLHIRKVWAVEPDPHRKGHLYAGTHYGHLFESVDDGDSWKEVVGLHNAPLRKVWGVDWGMGTTGLTVHTVRVDPHRKDRVFIISSGAGPYRSDDGGKNWVLLRNGVLEGCTAYGSSKKAPYRPVSSNESLQQHLETVHVCTHKVAFSSVGYLYQQNHCGVFRSKDSGDSWTDVSPEPRKRHGFPIVVSGSRRECVFTVPAHQGICKKHNSCIIGKIEVLRSCDRGRSWVKLGKGLPSHSHTCVLRDGMGTPGKGSSETFFGTTTGEVYGSLDEGDSWERLAEGVGRVQGVSAYAVT